MHTAGGPLPQPVIEHDTGGGWMVVASPEITAANGGSLSSLACLSADGLLGARFRGRSGWSLVGTHAPTYWGQNVVEHYDGRSWSRVPSLELSMNTGTLGSITCPASGYCYAVGSGPTQGVSRAARGLFLALTFGLTGATALPNWHRALPPAGLEPATARLELAPIGD